jgi:hypothetical protein
VVITAAADSRSMLTKRAMSIFSGDIGRDRDAGTCQAASDFAYILDGGTPDRCEAAIPKARDHAVPGPQRQARIVERERRLSAQRALRR